MTTVVFQSYRTSNVPAWISRCMETVQNWTSRSGFHYHFVDDRMFDYAPDWYRQRVANNVCLVSDLARLLIAKELLATYQRAIWIDADVVIFEPDRFSIPVGSDYLFCREIWVGFDSNGKLGFREGVNNSICAFCRGNSLIDFYAHACLTIIKHKKLIDRLEVGTNFLSGLSQIVPLPLLRTVALLSPVMMDGIIRRDADRLRLFRNVSASPSYAANVCSSFRDRVQDGITVSDSLFESVIEELCSTRGAGLVPTAES